MLRSILLSCCTCLCNSFRSILQLSDDDSTSITKLKKRKKRRENGHRVALVSVQPDRDTKCKMGKCDRAVDGVVDGVVDWGMIRGSHQGLGLAEAQPVTVCLLVSSTPYINQSIRRLSYLFPSIPLLLYSIAPYSSIIPIPIYFRTLFNPPPLHRLRIHTHLRRAILMVTSKRA